MRLSLTKKFVISFACFAGMVLIFASVALSNDKIPDSAVSKSNSVHTDKTAAAAGAELRAKLLDLAKDDHITLLKLAIANYKKQITDYTGTFHKQERIRGKLGKKQTISFKFREKPFSVAMKWEKNAGTANRLLYVEGSNDNKMIVHPTGLLSIIKSARVDPRGTQALKSNLKPCDMFGFHRNMIETLKVYEQAERNGDLKIRYSDIETIDDRNYITIERILPQKKDYPAARLLMKFDLKYLMPVGICSFDWQGRLISEYGFSDLKFNPGLKDADFDPKANRL